MDWTKYIIWIVIGIQYIGFGVWYVWRNYIRPFLSYKLTVFDTDDEYIFVRRKRDLRVINDKKTIALFKSKANPTGELYTIPLEQEADKHLSKRDDSGMVAYYFWRNNTNPLHIASKSSINVETDATLLSKIMATKILDSSLMMEEKHMKVNWKLVIAFIVVVVVVIFHKQITTALGLGV